MTDEWITPDAIPPHKREAVAAMTRALGLPDTPPAEIEVRPLRPATIARIRVGMAYYEQAVYDALGIEDTDLPEVLLAPNHSARDLEDPREADTPTT